MMQPSQTMTTYSLVRHPKKQNYSIPTISTPYHYSQRIATTFSSILIFHIPIIITSVSKEYICFLKEGKTDQATRCIESRIITNVIDSVLSIDTFEQQFVVLKGMLQSPRLKILYRPLVLTRP